MNSKSILNTVDIIRFEADTKLIEARRGAMGQYMTPAPLAELISSMFNDFSGKLQLLDAGAGVGSLTASFSDRAIQDVNCTDLSIETYELDDTLSFYLSDTIGHIKTAVENTEINFTTTNNKTDFIHAAVSQLKEMRDGKTLPVFNRVILNPPYVKISTQSQERKLLREVGIETGNLYSAFVALSLLLMSDDGELVAITPRSFCNGPHFKNIRDILLDGNYLSKIHVFESRKLLFKDNNVLQENLIFHVIKGQAQGPVTITSSSSSDTKILSTRIADFSEVVNVNDPAKFIRIVTNDKQANIAEKLAALPSTLDELGINVSTGKVVDFRTKENLSIDFIKGSVPLIYPQHFLNSSINWPKTAAKKPNALLLNPSTDSLVVQNGVYVLTC